MPDNTQTRPYIAHTWQEGDTITADLLNAIEQGIASIDSEMVEARTDDPNGDKTINTLGNRIDDLVMIQNTQPTSINNEIWVDSSETETIKIPSYEDYENLLNGIGEQYDEDNGTYEVGDHVLHDSELYRCKVNITEPESWMPAHWENVSIADELSTFTDEIVKASDKQPTSTFNRIWIDSDIEEIDVPTYEEFQALEGDVDELKSQTNELNNNVYDKLLSTNVLWSSASETVTGTTYAKKTVFTKNNISAGDYFYLSADSVSGNTYDHPFQIILYDDNDTLVKSVSGTSAIYLTVTDQYIQDGATHAVFILYASASTPLSGDAVYVHPYILDNGTAVNVGYSDNLGAYIDSQTNDMEQRITTIENEIGITFAPDEHVENLTCPSAAAGNTAELISNELTANGEYVCFVDPANVSGIVFIGPRKTATGREQINTTSGIVNVGTTSTGALYLTSNTYGTYSGDCYVFDVTNKSSLKALLLSLSYDDIEPMLGHLVLGKVPSMTSDLINDSDFVSADDLPEIKNGVFELTSTTTSMTSGGTINISAFPHYLNKDLGIVFYGTFSTFTSLRIGIGYQEYRGRWIEIDGTNLVIKMANTAGTETTVSTNAHGLTFSDYVSVNYYVDDDGVESIAIGTKGGSYTATGNSFMHNGTLFAYAGQSMSNVVFSGIAAGAKKPLWVFGDSYLGFVNDRVMGNLRTLGYTKGICVNALAGLFPGQAYEDLQRMLAISTPKILVWALGMNSDGNFATTLAQVVALCEEKNIELILYLCPSVPGKEDRQPMRTAVEATGLRAIDANLAVGASSDGATWYSGYLSDDNVHPTQIGAMALAMRYLVDAPEIMQYRNDA